MKLLQMNLKPIMLSCRLNMLFCKVFVSMPVLLITQTTQSTHVTCQRSYAKQILLSSSTNLALTLFGLIHMCNCQLYACMAQVRCGFALLEDCFYDAKRTYH